jgi:PAS domain S-box-containing protein
MGGKRKRNFNSEEGLWLEDRHVIDIANVGIFKSTLEGDVLFVNDALVRMGGFKSREELISEGALLRYKHPEKRKELLKILQKNGEVLNFEIEFLFPNRKTRYALVNARLDGDIISGAIIDITSLRKAEKALEESNTKFQKLFDIVPTGIGVADLSGNIIEANMWMQQSLGYSNEEFRKLKVDELFVDASQRKILRESLTKKGEVRNFEIALKKKDGSIQLSLINSDLVRRKGKKLILTTCRDVTEQKKIEDKFRESEKKYRTIVEHIPDALYIFDFTGTILEVNTVSCELLGYFEEELIGSSLTRIQSEEHRRFLADRLRSIKEHGHLVFEETHVKKDGTLIPVQVSAKVVSWEDGGVVQSFVRDVSGMARTHDSLRHQSVKLLQLNHELNVARGQLKVLNQNLEKKVKERTTEIEKLMKQRDDFFIELGHDLKTPLTPLLNLPFVLANDEKDPEKKKLLDMIIANVNRLKNTVFKTIDLTSLSSPSFHLQTVNLDLSSEITSWISEYKRSHHLEKITLDTAIDEGLIIQANRDLIGKLLDNLMSNAVKYCPDGGKVSLSLTGTDAMITLSITDTGIGMTEDQLGHIFEEFYKADESRHDLMSSGLGLPICKRIVEVHGGHIWAESPGSGKGSTFYVTLPKAEGSFVDNDGNLVLSLK